MQSAAASLTPHLLRLLDNLPLMVFAKHAHDLRFAFINRAGAELIGVPANQLLGKTDHDFFPQAQADHFVARDRQVIASGELDIVEEPIETASGARTLRTRKVVLTDEDGAPQFLLGISEDITEARAHDEERQRLNWFLNAVVDNLPVMLFVKHADDLRFALWNRAGADLIGQPRDEIVGKTDHDFFPKEQADHFVARDRMVLDSGQLDVVEEPIETPEGERLLQTKKIPLRDDTGTTRYLLGISEDITARKEAEAALKASHRAIEETLAQLIAMEPLAVAGQQAHHFARELKAVAARGRKTTLIDLVGSFADAMGAHLQPIASAPGTVELNEVLTHAAQGRAIKVEVGTGHLVAVGGRADAVQVLQALLDYLTERAPAAMALKALVDDGLPRIVLSAKGALPPVERVRLLRAGAELPDVSSTVRARLALARSAARRSGIQLSTRSVGERVLIELIFEPLPEVDTAADPSNARASVESLRSAS